MFDTVLIANRGEIALRILRACQGLGLKTVVAHSDVDRDAVYVRQADQALCIGPASPSLSYLNQSALLYAADPTGGCSTHSPRPETRSARIPRDGRRLPASGKYRSWAS